MAQHSLLLPCFIFLHSTYHSLNISYEFICILEFKFHETWNFVPPVHCFHPHIEDNVSMLHEYIHLLSTHGKNLATSCWLNGWLSSWIWLWNLRSVVVLLSFSCNELPTHFSNVGSKIFNTVYKNTYRKDNKTKHCTMYCNWLTMTQDN